MLVLPKVVLAPIDPDGWGKKPPWNGIGNITGDNDGKHIRRWGEGALRLTDRSDIA